MFFPLHIRITLPIARTLPNAFVSASSGSRRTCPTRITPTTLAFLIITLSFIGHHLNHLLGTCKYHVFDSSNKTPPTLIPQNYTGHQLFSLTVLTSCHQPLQHGRIRIPIDIHQKRGRHQVGRYLRLFIQHVIVGVSHQRAVIRVEKQLFGQLFEQFVARSEPEYQNVTVRIGGGDDLSVRRPSDVEDGAVTLVFDRVEKPRNHFPLDYVPHEQLAVMAC